MQPRRPPDSEQMLRIRLADPAADSLEVPSLMLRALSHCAANLPPDAREWDLSNLLIEGSPVPRPVVVAWLNRLCRIVDDSTFEERQSDLALTSSGLSQLLRFADAVGSRRGLLTACLAQLKDLKLRIELAGWTVELPMCTTNAVVFITSNPLQVVVDNNYRLPPLPSADARQQFIKTAAAQVEQLLYLSYALQLGPLVDTLHTFLRCSAVSTNGVLYGARSQVFSERVLDVAVGANKLGQQMWVQAVLTGPGALASVDWPLTSL